MERGKRGAGDSEWTSDGPPHNYDNDGPDNIAGNMDDEEWKNAIGSFESGVWVGRQKASGLVVHTSTDVKVYNNIVWAKNYVMTQHIRSFYPSGLNLDYKNNLVGPGTKFSSNLDNVQFIGKRNGTISTNIKQPEVNNNYTINVTASNNSNYTLSGNDSCQGGFEEMILI